MWCLKKSAKKCLQDILLWVLFKKKNTRTQKNTALKKQNHQANHITAVITWSEIGVSLGLHGPLHLLHHPLRNREWLELIHPHIWTIPACIHTSHVKSTVICLVCYETDDVRLTCTHRCGINPGCPPQSAGMPQYRKYFSSWLAFLFFSNI